MIGELTNENLCPVCNGNGKIVLPLRYSMRVADMKIESEPRSRPVSQAYVCPECRGVKPDFFREPRLLFCEAIVTAFDYANLPPEDYVYHSMAQRLAKHLIENEFVRREKTEMKPDMPDGKTYKYGIYLRVVAP